MIEGVARSPPTAATIVETGNETWRLKNRA
jgi:hypothetical protein